MKITHQLENIETRRKPEMIAFLNDIENLKKLLPPEKIENWEFPEANACTFKIQGISEFGMKHIKDLDENNSIGFFPYGKVPFGFELTINFRDNTNKNTDVELIFDADINTALSFILKKPLSNLFDYFIKSLNQEVK